MPLPRAVLDGKSVPEGFSFTLNNRGFGILLRSLSSNSPFSDSWSVTTIRFG